MKIKPPKLTRDEVERLVGDIAQLTNEQRRLKADIDEAIIAARKRHEVSLGDIADQLKEKSSLVQAWAELNHLLFTHKKSLELTHGTIGFRTGTPKLKTLPRRTFEAALESLLSCPWGMDFVRIKHEINKEGILAAHAADQFPAENLKSIGLYVAQDESFFIEPNLQEQPSNLRSPISAP